MAECIATDEEILAAADEIARMGLEPSVRMVRIGGGTTKRSWKA